MKLISLSINNIASIPSAFIDFTAEPLASAPVYLISGNTGAGKSTILDSICLALYANTPRLQRLAEAGHRSVETEDGNKYTDSRAMARLDAVQASAELCFIGNDGIRYKATWATARPYKKADRPFRAHTHTLEFTQNGNTIVLEKVAQVREQVERAVGLDFKKFCRTTMLAQGDFTRFLHAPNEEKSEILEKITGTDIYRRISIRIRENYKARKEAANDLQQQLANIVLLTEEELAHEADELRTLELKNQELKSYSESLANQIVWLQNETTLTEQLKVFRQNFADAEAVATGPQIADKKALVDQYDKTEEPRAWSAEITKAEREKTQILHDLDELAAHALDLRGGLEFLRNTITSDTAKAQELKSLIDREEPKVEVYGREKIITTKLTSLMSERANHAQLLKDFSALDAKIKTQLQKEFDQAAAYAEACIKSRLELQQSAEDLEAILEAKRPEQIRQALDRLKTEKAEVERRNRIVALREEIERSRTELNNLNVRIGDARIKRDEAKQVYEHERESVDVLIKKLRAGLTPGCSCPLCRQTVEIMPVESDIEMLIVGYEKNYRDAESIVTGLEAEANRLTAKIEVAQKSINEEETNLPDPVRSIAAINNEIASVEALLAEINDLSVKLKELNKQLKEATAKADQANEALAAVNSRMGSAQTALATLRGKIDAVEISIGNTESEIISLTAGYESAYSPLKQPAEFSSQLTCAAQTYSKAIETLNELNRHIETTREQYTRNTRIIDQINLPCNSKISPIRIADIDQEVSALNAKVAAKRQTEKNAVQTIQRARVQIAGFLADNHMPDFILKQILELSADEIAQARRDISAASDALISARTILDDALRRYAEHTANRPADLGEISPEELSDTKQKTDDETIEVNRRIGIITQKLSADKEARASHAERLRELEEKRKDEERWRQLDNLFGDTTGKKFVNIAQTYVLMDLIDSANKYMSTLSDRYRLRVHPNSFVIYIDDAYDGGASRPANTISGGESFLVSLALALALSDIAEGLEVDTLFIDEGFGTLSGQPLKDAIATLTQLHSQTGRHVGIISHVEELRAELPVQIQVIQNPATTESHIKITSDQ